MRNNILISFYLFLCIPGLALSGGSHDHSSSNGRNQGSQHSSESGSQKNHKKPPKEAMQACQNSASGDSCTFSGKNKESVSGTCFSPESSAPLACKPDNH